MKFFQKLPKSSIGIDIGNSSAKAVQLSSSANKTSLDAYNNLVLSDYDIEDPKELYDALQTILNSAIYGKFSSQNIALSLPYNIAFETIVSFEKNGLQTTKKNIEYELQNVYNLNTAQFSINYAPLGSHQLESAKTIYTYSVVCIPKAFYTELQTHLSKQEFVNIVLLPKFVSVNKNFVKKQKPLILVDLGHYKSIYFFSDGKRFVQSSIDFSTNKLNQIIVKNLSVEPKNLSHVLANVGLQNNAIGVELRSATRDYLNQLVDEIKSNLNDTSPFLQGVPNESISLQLAGTIASMPELPEYIQKHTGINTVLANPWQKLPIYPLKPMPKYRNPQYALAIGLSHFAIS